MLMWTAYVNNLCLVSLLNPEGEAMGNFSTNLADHAQEASWDVVQSSYRTLSNFDYIHDAQRFSAANLPQSLAQPRSY